MSEYIVTSGQTSTGIVLYYDTMRISEGGTANSTTVSSGSMVVSNGGTANSTTVEWGGNLHVSSGGTANSTTVNPGCNMFISYGGCQTGQLTITAGAVVSAYAGAVIDFTVAGRTTEDDYLINNVSRIRATPTYTITVAADQAEGTYKLAQGAAEFTGTLSLWTADTNYGTITVNGESIAYGDYTYTLAISENDLLLTVDCIYTIENLVVNSYSTYTVSSGSAVLPARSPLPFSEETRLRSFC